MLLAVEGVKQRVQPSCSSSSRRGRAGQGRHSRSERILAGQHTVAGLVAHGAFCSCHARQRRQQRPANGERPQLPAPGWELSGSHPPAHPPTCPSTQTSPCRLWRPNCLLHPPTCDVPAALEVGEVKLVVQCALGGLRVHPWHSRQAGTVGRHSRRSRQQSGVAQQVWPNAWLAALLGQLCATAQR
jgi:hypothetical protein